MMAQQKSKFTGWHMLTIMLAFFGVVIAVNLLNAYYAAHTFGGLVVENSYVASQKFNGWLAQAREEKALGWKSRMVRDPKDFLDLSVIDTSGKPIDGAIISAVVRHPLGRAPERAMHFKDLGDGTYHSVEPLLAGRWIIHLAITGQGHTVHRIVDMQ